METGTGIFLGACVISLTMLYTATKDRWPWRRIVLLVPLVTLVIPLGLFWLSTWEPDTYPEGGLLSPEALIFMLVLVSVVGALMWAAVTIFPGFGAWLREGERAQGRERAKYVAIIIGVVFVMVTAWTYVATR